MSTLSSPAADRIELMQTFVHIVEAGSLSAAALQMGATQPTVSRRLQSLERSLGVRLLRRSTHAMKLTEDGERCYERARELLADWHAFEADLRGVGDEPEGTLRVVAPHALGQLLLVGPLADYLRAYPRVSVEWLLNDRRPDFIAEGVDCAIQVGEVTDTLAVALKLSEVPRVVVAAPSVLAGRAPPAHPSELAELPWLALRTFYRNEVLLTHRPSGEVARVPIRPRMSTDSLYALQSAARMGLGACMASAWLVNEDIAAGRLVQLVPQWHVAPLPVYLIYPPSRFQPARLRRFIETMRLALADPAGRTWEAGAA
ncbi:LysR family transcriptional regulator [Variovorax paradoxus]|uniref:LysR family transcriptional regulator n=1 Tax=Variovorax paradoxus TaxID=34073 RepID=UPI000783D448|nr:LysR family transcriptional regulator [Variovorax paradoxus]